MPVNIYDQQARNRRKSAFLIAAFVLFLALIGYGFDLFVFGNDPIGLVAGRVTGPPLGILLGVLLGGAWSMQSYFAGDRMVLASTHAHPVDPAIPREQVLDNVVTEVALAAGIPRPRVFVVPDPDLNAFTVGRDPAHASLAVTEGLLDAMPREELQGVVAHELAHVTHYDIRTMTLVAVLLGSIALLSDWGLRAGFWGGYRGRRRGSDDRGGAGAIFLVVWILLLVLAPLVGQIMALAVSRSREYMADAGGAELTRNPLGLAKALKRIEDAVEPTRSIGRGSAHLCIADPLGRRANLAEGGRGALFATHPPMERRIAALEEMAYVMPGAAALPHPPTAAPTKSS